MQSVTEQHFSVKSKQETKDSNSKIQQNSPFKESKNSKESTKNKQMLPLGKEESQTYYLNTNIPAINIGLNGGLVGKAAKDGKFVINGSVFTISKNPSKKKKRKSSDYIPRHPRYQVNESELNFFESILRHIDNRTVQIFEWIYNTIEKYPAALSIIISSSLVAFTVIMIYLDGH
ncbi:uncharacterized protein KGF55_000940 [Candida pseudojiufengensis]|uniref:uncharacterized protein n=1 Tax=Candida pseudojiufengensis TaxID=497109 RepID=UPI0022258F9F|nr:uncharacterized protein KGF55_000940 [Candida pseudojiufengensis]KAI5965578.1 hypothetical protein KGF55_000940 [Candida pseudojiufengensis]